MYDSDEQDGNKRSGIRQTSDVLLDAYASEKVHQHNIDAVKNRKGKNEPVARQDDTETTSDSGSSLKEKDGLEKDNELDDEKDLEKEEVKEQKSLDRNVRLKEAAETATGIANLKKKWIKLKLEIKIGIFIAAITAGLLVFLVLYSALASAIDTFTGAITNFFGISEGNIKEEDGVFRTGLYTEKNYLFDEDGNELSSED